MSASDSFWESWNLSRCKTAMLIMSVLLVGGAVLSELLNGGSEFLKTSSFTVLAYWMGRHSKSKEK